MKTALSKIAHALPSKGTVPIVDGVYFGDVIMATDLMQSAVYSGFSFKPIVLPSKIVEIVQVLDGDINVTVDDNFNATITAGKSKFKLHGQDPADYPLNMSGEIISEVIIPGNTLKEKFNLVTFAASTEVSRPAFQGVRIDSKLIASDTYRLAMADLELPGQCLVPAKFLHNLKLLPDSDIKVGIGQDFISFTAGELTLTSRLLNDKYPDISGVIPKEHKTAVSCAKHDLIGMIQRALLLAEGKNKAINLVADDSLTVKVSGQQGSLEEAASADVEGEPVDLFVNAKYLLDVLKVAPEKINIKFHGESGPVVVEWEGYYYLLLPIKKTGGE